MRRSGEELRTDVTLSEFRHSSEGAVEGVEVVLVPTPTIDVNDPLVRIQLLPNPRQFDLGFSELEKLGEIPEFWPDIAILGHCVRSVSSIGHHIHGPITNLIIPGSLPSRQHGRQ